MFINSEGSFIIPPPHKKSCQFYTIYVQVFFFFFYHLLGCEGRRLPPLGVAMGDGGR